MSRDKLAAAEQVVAAAQEKLEEAARDLPEAAQVRKAKAKAGMARQVYNTYQAEADRVAADRILCGLRAAPEEIRADLLMEMANRVTDRRTVSRLGVAMRALADEDRDPLFIVPALRRLIQRQSDPNEAHRLPFEAVEAINESDPWVRQLGMPFNRFVGEVAATRHDRMFPSRIGGGTYPVTRAVCAFAGHAEMTVLVRLHDGSLVAAPRRLADPFIRGLDGGRAKPGRTVV